LYEPYAVADAIGISHLGGLLAGAATSTQLVKLPNFYASSESSPQRLPVQQIPVLTDPTLGGTSRRAPGGRNFGSGPDSLRGNAGADLIFGLGGPDSVFDSGETIPSAAVTAMTHCWAGPSGQRRTVRRCQAAFRAAGGDTLRRQRF